MRRLKKLIAVLCTAVCMFSLMVAPVYADTDGTELQVAEASRLEIQLGAAWSGVEFQLKTDVGLYPEPIVVGEDGVLRLEIGGSGAYTLSCLNSPTVTPEVDETASTETEGQVTKETPAPDLTDAEQTQPTPETPGQTGPVLDPEAQTPDDNDTQSGEDNEKTVAGIPTMHIVLFGGGLLLAGGALIAIRVVSRRREADDGYDYDDEDD